MGCGVSKTGEGSFVNLCMDEGCLVSLCKERKDLIRAARDCRYVLSASHVLYLRSLLEFSNALDVFLKEAVVVSVESPFSSSVVDSPLHSLGDSHLYLSSEDSESVILGSATDEVHKGENDGRSKLSSPRGSVDSNDNKIKILMKPNMNPMMRSPAEAITELLEPDVEYMPSIFNHPDGFPQNEYWFPADGTGTRSRGTVDTHYYSGYNFSDYGDESSFSFPAYSSVQVHIGEYGIDRPMGYYRDISCDYQPYAQPNPSPIPSPPMTNSTTDYFGLFSITDDFFFSSYYSRNLYENGLGSEYPDLNYMHDDERIPPLDKIVEETPSEPFKVSKATHETHLEATRHTTEEHPVESDIAHMAGGKCCNHNGQGEDNYSVKTSVEKDDNVTLTLTLTIGADKDAFLTDLSSSLGDGKIINEGKSLGQLKQAKVNRHLALVF